MSDRLFSLSNARGYVVEYNLFSVRHDSVARVVSTLVSYYQVSSFGYQINYPSLALIPPLRTQDHYARQA